MQLKHNRTQDAEEVVLDSSEQPAPRHHAAADYDDGLLAAAAPIMIVAYGAALGIAAMTFSASGEALLAITICVVYAVMFFGVPYLMINIRKNRDERWRTDGPERISDRISIHGGMIRRHEALLQMVIVPACVAVAFASFAIIWISLRP